MLDDNKRVVPKKNCNCGNNLARHKYIRKIKINKKEKQIKEIKNKASKKFKLFL